MRSSTPAADPNRLAPPMLKVLLRMLVGDVRKFGLPKPDHPPLSTHPIMNTQLLHHLGHGNISAKPDVAELRGKTVRFTDGSEIEPDVILWATGYKPTLPRARSGRGAVAETVNLYLNMFCASTRDCAYSDFRDGGCRLSDSEPPERAARRGAHVAGEEGRRRARVRAAAREAACANGGMRYLKSPRHAFYVQFDTYMKELDQARKRVERASGH